jgi:hypothetical protein
MHNCVMRIIRKLSLLHLSVQADPVATSSSTPTAPPASAMLSRILDTVLSIQQEVNTMSVRVEQNHINIRQFLRHFEPEDDDDDDGKD